MTINQSIIAARFFEAAFSVFAMAKSTKHFRFSLTNILLFQIVVFAVIILVSTQFKQRVVSTKSVIGVTLNSVEDATKASEKIGIWLQNSGYKPCSPPDSAPKHSLHREAWYIGKHDRISLYLGVHSLNSDFAVEVHYEFVKWQFEDTRVYESAVDSAVVDVSMWWQNNSTILNQTRSVD